MEKIKRLARPRTGRKMYSHSVSLTLEQIEWLRQFPNASELLRKMIDSMRKLHGAVEPQLSLLAMKHEVDLLEEEKKRVWKERGEFVALNFDLNFEEKEIIYTPNSKFEKPEFMQAQREAYNQAIAVIERRLEELKERFTREVNLINK